MSHGSAEPGPPAPPPGPPRPPTMADVLQLPDAPRALMLWLLRREEATLAEVVAEARLPAEACRALLDGLISGGFLQESPRDGTSVFKPLLSARRGRQVPGDIWTNLQV